MEDDGGGGRRDVGSVVFDGTLFTLNDLVHVFVGTGAYVKGRQTEVIVGRFKGVRIEGEEERSWFVRWWGRKGAGVPRIRHRLVVK